MIFDPPTCGPMVLAHNDRASLIFCCGTLKERETLRLGELIRSEARRPDRDVVYVSLVVLGGRLGSLRTATAEIQDARRHARVVCYLYSYGYGIGTLWLAYQCDEVWAEPQTKLGWIGCHDELTDESEFSLTVGMIDELADLRPQVARDTWPRLIGAEIIGEQAEALGLVDGLSCDVFKLANMDPHKWAGPPKC
jgi:hypothetical protein